MLSTSEEIFHQKTSFRLPCIQQTNANAFSVKIIFFFLNFVQYIIKSERTSVLSIFRRKPMYFPERSTIRMIYTRLSHKTIEHYYSRTRAYCVRRVRTLRESGPVHRTGSYVRNTVKSSPIALAGRLYAAAVAERCREAIV